MTADSLGVADGQSAWWIHAQDEPELRRLAGLVRPFGTLGRTIVADTGPGREVLRGLGGRAAAG